MDYLYRPPEGIHLTEILRRIKNDFPTSERAPSHIIRKHIKSGVFEAFALVNGDYTAAYTVNVPTADSQFVLLNYLAVDAGLRGSGVGSVLLERIKEQYADRLAVLAEVELPEEASGPEERRIRERRVVFYERAGFQIVPDIEYSIFGVKMHIMTWSARLPVLEVRPLVDDVIHGVYQKFLPRMFWNAPKLKYL